VAAAVVGCAAPPVLAEGCEPGPQATTKNKEANTNARAGGAILITRFANKSTGWDVTGRLSSVNGRGTVRKRCVNAAHFNLESTL
jgi:hypothetical protein